MKKARSFFVLVFLLAIVSICTRCSKEYSYEGGPIRIDTTTSPPVPTDAVFTLEGSPGTCGNSTVSGTYIEGQSLSNFNTLDLTVNVTAPGNYSIETDKVNGMSFSTSGTFASAGTQTVRLEGTGKPDAAGLFSFTPSTGLSSCSIDVQVQNSEPLAIYVLESGNGAINPCIYTLAGTARSQTPLTAANTISMSVFIQTPGNYTIQTSKVNGMIFSSSGSFSASGQQYVTLTGSGTPVAKGDFVLVPQIIGPHPLGGESCGVTITVE